MVTITKGCISIHIAEEDTEAYVERLKEAIVIAIQQLDYELCPQDQAQFMNYHLGDLLRKLCLKETSFD